MPMLRSFKSRLLAGLAIVIALSLFLSAFAFTLMLRQQQAEAEQQRIGVLVGPLTDGARNMELRGWTLPMMRPVLSDIARDYGIRILLTDGASGVVLDTDTRQSLLGDRLSLAEAVQLPDDPRILSFRSQRLMAHGDDLYFFTIGAQQRGVLAAPTVSAHNLVIAVPAANVTSAWWRLLRPLSLAGLGAGVVAVIFASLFASRITNPIAQVTRASQAMARGDLSQRIDVDGDDEVGWLAQAFNDMSDQVSRSHRAMRDLLANVSHELRTPLTSIQGFSQALMDGLPGDPKETGAVINEEADRIRLLVDDLLYLSQIESGALHLDLDGVDVDALIDGSVRRFRFQAEESQVSLRTALAGDTVRVDGRRIEQVLANLIDNAIRFAPEGSDVLLSSKRVAGGVFIEVHNGGEPIPADRVEHVFDRFYQVDTTRSAGRHRGLGLSIVQELVQAHGGTATVESTAEAGTTFSVFLPTSGPSVEAPPSEAMRRSPSLAPPVTDPHNCPRPR
ncbi:MAG: sensor histidine kinase [Chloroflexi bacterium]|nr:MAG: sensor histidine kinase [Chloroflexota bacterium]